MLRVLAVAIAAAAAACGGRRDEPPAPAASATRGGDAGAGSARSATAPTDAAPTADGELPAACVRYRALAERAAGCEALGAQRALLRDPVGSAWSAWRALPPEDRGELAPDCATAADALAAAGAAACGW